MESTVSSTPQVRPRPRSLGGGSLKRMIGPALAYAMLVALSAFILLPLGWMLTVALKPDNTPVFTIPPEWFPTRYWHWENFGIAMLDPARPFLRYTWNTLQIVAGNIVGTLFSCSLVAFAFARLRFRGSEFLFNILIITMLIPWQV